MTQIRKFNVLKDWQPHGCYHGGFEEITEMKSFQDFYNSIKDEVVDGIWHPPITKYSLSQVEDVLANILALDSDLQVAYDGSLRTYRNTPKGLEEVAREPMIKKGQHSGNKYHRKIHSVDVPQASITVDVYCVLQAFNVTNPGLQHALKKLLCAGLRGKGDKLQDLKEAQDAISRAITLEQCSTGTQD